MARFKTGQLTISAAGQQLRPQDGIEFGQYKIKALSTNAANVAIGDSAVTTGTGYLLAAGEEILYDLANHPGTHVDDITLDQWWAIGSAGDKLTWLALVR